MAKYADVTAGQTEACINRLGGWDNFLRFIGGQGKVVFDSILEFVRTVTIGAQPAVTTNKKYFEDAGAKWMGENFQNQFLGLEVSETKEIELAVRKLTEDSLDEPILKELGDKAETSVSTFHTFLNQNRESSEWFIFYLRGKDGNLWAVSAHWSSGDGGWYLYAFSVADPDGWLAEGQVVSRN